MPEQIRNILRKRGINNVVHFTCTDNLDNILNIGVVPRSQLNGDNINFVFNDHVRLDNRLNYSCFSIEFPNQKMLSKLMNDNPNKKWAILVFDSQILYQYNCLFYYHNAAKTEFRNEPIENYRGSEALERMFTYNEEQREEYLYDSYPTEVQAEVMISDIVEMKFLRCCVINDEPLVDKYSKNFSNIKFIYHASWSKYFSTRKAYRYGH